ncbi:MAG: hypothetical protein V4722_17220 [Bacteroidota bacterium]
MKTLFKGLGLSIVLIIGSLSFFAFKKYQQVKTATDVFRSIIYDGIYSNANDITVWPDSTMIIARRPDWDTTRVDTIGPVSLCNSNPVYFYYKLAQGIGVGDIETYEKAALINFKQAFGKDLFGPGIKLPGKDYNNKPAFIKQFKADALKTAFDKLYKKPTEDFDGFAMQKIYDITVKDYFRSFAAVIGDIMKKKPMFVLLAADFKKKALTRKDFYGPEAAYDIQKKLLGEAYTPGQGLDNCIDGVDKIIGMMVRRHIDGTLPTLLTCAKTVLKDYDPEFYATIQNSF